MTDTSQTTQPHDSIAADGGQVQAKAALRLLATVQIPAGLEERVHRRLAQAGIAEPHRMAWIFGTPMRRLQFAGVAIAAIAVAASTWSVYQGRAPYPPQHPPQAVLPIPDSAGGFKSSGAERRPSTIAPIMVSPAAKKKPRARLAVKHLAKPATSTGDAKAAVTPQN